MHKKREKKNNDVRNNKNYNDNVNKSANAMLKHQHVVHFDSRLCASNQMQYVIYHSRWWLLFFSFIVNNSMVLYYSRSELSVCSHQIQNMLLYLCINHVNPYERISDNESIEYIHRFIAPINMEDKTRKRIKKKTINWNDCVFGVHISHIKRYAIFCYCSLLLFVKYPYIIRYKWLRLLSLV